MEIVAMDMKLRGMYIARQLSFHGVSFKIEEVPLIDSFKKSYDDSVELVSSHWNTRYVWVFCLVTVPLTCFIKILFAYGNATK